MSTWDNPSKIAVSKDSAANCRLLLLNERVLCDFSDEKTRKRFSAGENVEKLEPVALDQSDIVTVGKTGLRAHATTKTHENKTVIFRPEKALDLSKTPALKFAFSSYGGEHDSTYFRDMSENKISQGAPDPLLLCCRDIGAPLGETVYVGDMEIDLQTALSAGTRCVLVSWGFRSAKELEILNAPVAHTPAELGNILK